MATSRDRMIDSAITLFRQRGVAGTSFSDVIEHSGAPRGSIYHYFPAGKAQLAEEATRRAGDFITALVVGKLGAGDPVAAVDAFVEFWERMLQGSGYHESCPLTAAALAEAESPGARAAAADAFDAWETAIAESLRSHGIEAARARTMAALAVVGIQGAVVVARAKQSMEPLRSLGAELQRVLREELAAVESANQTERT